MSLTRQLRVALAGVLAGVSACLALMHLIALTTGGDIRVGNWRFAPIGAGYARRAEELVTQKTPSAGNLTEAARLSELALDEFPYDTSSWLRIAYIDQLRNGELSKFGTGALARSYDLVAVDPSMGPWRVHFALENWPNLSNELKKSARDEAAALASEPRNRLKLKGALDAVKNPESAVMVTLWRQRYVDPASLGKHTTP